MLWWYVSVCLPLNEPNCDMSMQLLRFRAVLNGDWWLNEAAVFAVEFEQLDIGSLLIQSLSIALDALRLKCSRKLSIWNSIEFDLFVIFFRISFFPFVFPLLSHISFKFYFIFFYFLIEISCFWCLKLSKTLISLLLCAFFHSFHRPHFSLECNSKLDFHFVMISTHFIVLFWIIILIVIEHFFSW